MLSSLSTPGPDPLWGLMTQFLQDRRPAKIDLVVGVYRDEFGRTPVLSAVQAVECRLASQGLSKAYRSLSGNAEFNAGMAKLLLGHDMARLDRQYTMQTVGGTGALRLLADFIVLAGRETTVWSSDPGYVNHLPIMEAAGLKVSPYRWQEMGAAFDTDAVLTDLGSAKPGDVVIIHGCCHNPTGIDMPLEAWAAVTDLCARKGIIPLVDMAYQGFGDGLEADAAGLRHMVDHLDTLLVAASCSKNMGLYCERTGSATIIGSDRAALRPVAGTLERITRRNYSMPPEHGAAIATALFAEPAPWLAELESMRSRVAKVRALLADCLADLGASERLQSLRRQKGMFSMLPVAPGAMKRLREDYAIYGTDNGRINIAGLPTQQVETFGRALVGVAQQT